jgi:MFS family permease
MHRPPSTISDVTVTAIPLFPTRTHIRVMILSVLIVAVDALPVFLLGAGAVTMGAEIGFGATGLGYLTAAFFLAAAAVSSPIGRVIERIGWQRAMRINLVGTSIVLAVMSVAIRNMVSLAALLVVAAGLYGFGNPAANQALAQMVEPDRQGVVFGLKHAGIPTSTLLAGLAVPLIILRVGWRASFLAGAFIALGVLALVPRRPPERSERSRSAERADPLLSPGRLRFLALAGVFATVAPSMLGTFTVVAAVDAGISEGAAGVLLSVGGFVTIVARVLNGALADRFRWRGFGLMSALMAAGAIAAYSLSVLTGSVYIVVVLCAFATAWGWPGLMTFSVVRANAGSVASSSAVAQAGVFVGAGVFPIVIGTMADGVSFSAAWLLVGTGLCLASVSIAGLARQLPR